MKIFLTVVLFSAHCVLSQVCNNNYPVWSVGGGDLLVNGQPFQLKGTSWFGFESDSHAPHGLWSHSVNHFVSKLADLKINALRLPFSAWLALNNPSTKNINCAANGQQVPQFGNARVCDLRSMDLMEYIVDKLGERGILVMMDQHRLHGGAWVNIETWITPLWYDNTFSEAQVLNSWDNLMQRFGRKWNVFGLDLKNEPRDPASWGKNPATDWNLAAERIIRDINQRHPEYTGLFFVEGVSNQADTTTPTHHAHWWGGNMEGVRRHPINTGSANLNARVVYSPHTYGPDVHNQEYFKDGSFPWNMPAIWDNHFGFVEDVTGHPIVTGEWGGKYGNGPTGQKDHIWHNAFADYLIAKCMSDNFYWCLNPNSADTNGLLLDDWSSFDQGKKELIRRIQPNPSQLTFDGTNYCFFAGSRANSNCGGNPPPPPASGQCERHVGQDIRDNDLVGISGKSEAECCDVCKNHNGCRAYAWSDHNQGTCWLKSATGPLIPKAGVIAGVVGSSPPPPPPPPPSGECQKHAETDIQGNDIIGVHGKQENECCEVCRNQGGCQAYAWTDYNQGTCWLKSATGPLKPAAGVTTGIIGTTTSECTDEPDVDYYGNDIEGVRNVDSSSQCCSLCGQKDTCVVFTYRLDSKDCWLKHAIGSKSACSSCVSGRK